MIVGIDPGPRESAIVAISEDGVYRAVDVENGRVVQEVIDCHEWVDAGESFTVAIEWIESFGMAVGASTFETVFAIGQIVERLKWNNYNTRLLPRRDVKLHLCQSPRANDGNIRQALIDRFGKCGTKKNPGPLYGISKHKWSALAIAVTALDLPTTDHEATFHKEVQHANHGDD